MLPKCKAHVESFDGQTKCLYFFDWKWEKHVKKTLYYLR